MEKLNGEKQDSGNDIYEKITYKLMPGPMKDIPKAVFAKKSAFGKFNPPDDLIKKYKKSVHLVKIKQGTKLIDNPDYDRNFVDELIDFYKRCLAIHEGWKLFNFIYKNTRDYQSIGDFYDHIKKQAYKIEFNPVAAEYITELVKSEKLFLFQIYNKDFSPHSKGKPNLHTLYFKALFNEKNLANPSFKLNGEAEIFFRDKSIPKKITHHKNEAIDRKLFNKEGPESKFTYDLIKDKRFTEDKFLFHVPLTLNFQAQENSDINKEVLAYIKDHDGVNIIGIDRGERNLLYISVLNKDGDIIAQKSLNNLSRKYQGKTADVPYKQLLDAKEDERKKSQAGLGSDRKY